MKLSDLFKDYCVKDGIKIVYIPNTKIYYAITNSQGIADRDVIYNLSKEQVDNLLNNKLSFEELRNATHRVAIFRFI